MAAPSSQPSMITKLMENPKVQGLLANPKVVELLHNEKVQQLLANENVHKVLNNPALQQTLMTLKDPSVHSHVIDDVKKVMAGELKPLDAVKDIGATLSHAKGVAPAAP